MKIDLDSIALELTQDLEKTAIPPKVYSKLRLWLKKLRSPRAGLQHMAQKAEDMIALDSLAKNEVMASFYANGIMKMDFGADVSETAKKAALRWAKKRGLKVVEATLAKSQGAPMSYVLGISDEIGPYGECLKRTKWSV